MRRLALVLIAGTLPLLSTGCAYLTTYKSSMNLESKSYSLDVKQRVVLSKERKSSDGTTAHRVVCAEPSPDALTTIAASVSAGFLSALTGSANAEKSDAVTSAAAAASGSNTQNANLAAALAEQGAFVGIRTPALQTMRDGLYSECQAYANGSVSDGEYAAFQRRHQSTMLGLIAIEQMTRPVVAQQVALTSNSSGQAGTPPADAALATQQTRLDAKRTENTEAQAALISAQGEVAVADKAISDNAAAEQKARADAVKGLTDEQAKTEASNKAAAPFIEKQKGLQDARTQKINAANAAQLRANSAAQAYQEAIADYKSAQARVAVTAGGNAQFGAVRDSSAQITKDLTDNVKNIVVEINASYLRDGCFTLMSDMIKNYKDLAAMKEPDNPKDFSPVAVVRTALANCKYVFASEAARMSLSTASSEGAKQEALKELGDIHIQKQMERTPNPMQQNNAPAEGK